MNANTMSYWSSLLVLVMLLVAGQQYLAAPLITTSCVADFYRLPEHIWPSHYKLDLTLDPSDDKFSGTVEIFFYVLTIMDSKIKERTISGVLSDSILGPNKIVLNAENLVATQVTFVQGNKLENVGDICHDANSNIMVLTLKTNLLHGRAKLVFKFEGAVQAEAKGLFRNTIGSSQTTLATNLKPNYARRLFPCFDEPEFKATFDLTIEHPKTVVALSNTQIIKSLSYKKNTVVTSFHHTPRMSTYLLSLAVGEFEVFMREGTNLMIYAPKGWANSASYMLDKALVAYEKVNRYFAGLRSQMAKIKIVAVNMEDIAADGWGLFSMKWNLLSATLQESKPDDFILAVTTLMRQMINQRFAYFVTMRWWDDMWVQEGLAAHLASELTADLPDIRSKLYRLVDTTFSAMNDDDRNERPITYNAFKKTANQIVSWHDSFADKKSEAIIRMFANFLGKEKIKSAIHIFINSSPDGNLMSADIWWNTLSREAPQCGDLRNVARQWAEQVGYPTLSVKLLNNRLLQVSQEPKLWENSPVWLVPVQYEVHGGPREEPVRKDEFILSGTTTTVVLPGWFDPDDKNQWIKLNSEYQGYYRVNYCPELKKRLDGPMISRKMRASDRMQMLSDLFTRNARSNSVDKLALMLAFISEDVNDGVMLLFTRMLGEMQIKKWNLGLSDLVSKHLLRYHEKNGGIKEKANKHATNECTRGEVVDYLVSKLNNSDVKKDIRTFLRRTGQLPAFLQKVNENLRWVR